MKTREVAELSEVNIDQWCSDFDEDCYTVQNKQKCYAYDPGKGKCHFICGHPEFDV